MRTLLFEEIGVEKERRRKKLNLILSVPSLLSSCMHLCHHQWNNLKIISLLGEQNQQTIYILSLPWTSISLSIEKLTKNIPGSAKFRRGSSPITHPLCAIRKQALFGTWIIDSSTERDMSSKGKVKYLGRYN